MSNCYCVCHSLNSSSPYCEHCKGNNDVATASADADRPTPDTQEFELKQIIARAMVTSRLEEWNDLYTLNDAVKAILANYISKDKLLKAIGDGSTDSVHNHNAHVERQIFRVELKEALGLGGGQGE